MREGEKQWTFAEGEFERKVKWVLDVRKLEDNDRLQLGEKVGRESYKWGVRNKLDKQDLTCFLPIEA